MPSLSTLIMLLGERHPKGVTRAISEPASLEVMTVGYRVTFY